MTLVRPAIIVGGQLVDCEAPVVDWLESNLHFPVAKRRRETRFVVCHWTGSENEPPAVHASMLKRKLAVHFIVSFTGTVYQCCDADMRGAHAAAEVAPKTATRDKLTGNDWGVGIEFVNRGHDTTVPTRNVRRETRIERVQGQRLTYAAMTEAQVTSAIALCAALCRAYSLPTTVPFDAKTRGVYPTVLPLDAIDRFRGVLGHFQIEPCKVDPGIDFLQRIDRGLNPPREVA